MIAIKNIAIDTEISVQRRQGSIMTMCNSIVMEFTEHRELPSEIDNLKICVYSYSYSYYSQY